MGAGGVGKTTLATGFAISLAKTGKKVVLMSIDPAKRLATALGLTQLSDCGDSIILPNHYEGQLTAIILDIDRKSFRRWVGQQVPRRKRKKISFKTHFSRH